MPADLPPVPPVIAIPYRAIAFAEGGGITLAILMLLVNLTGI